MMKKLTMICALACAVLAFSSCKSSESAYKKAYEKAKAQEAQNATPAVEEAPVVTPLETKPAAEAMVENATVRQENVELIDGAGLQTYSVVVGSFQLKANAEGLQSTLKSAGYAAQIVYNAERNMYRVVASTFADKAAAVQSRNQLREGNYPDAWLLYKN